MTSPHELMAWARQTARLFGVSMERALETAEMLTKFHSGTPAKANGELPLQHALTAPGVVAEEYDSVEQRRERVLKMVRSSSRRVDRCDVARAIFECDDMSDDAWQHACDIAGDDLIYLREQGLLQHKRPWFWPAA